MPRGCCRLRSSGGWAPSRAAQPRAGWPCWLAFVVASTQGGVLLWPSPPGTTQRLVLPGCKQHALPPQDPLQREGAPVSAGPQSRRLSRRRLRSEWATGGGQGGTLHVARFLVSPLELCSPASALGPKFSRLLSESCHLLPSGALLNSEQALVCWPSPLYPPCRCPCLSDTPLPACLETVSNLPSRS